jgi:N,N'-diacetyllegionaminate synthase
MTTVMFGDRAVGPGQPVLVVAEIGINHNGDVALAHEMIDAASAAGADGVKFQNYRTEDFVGDKSLMFTYQSLGRSVTESQFDLFKRCELAPEALGELRAHCDDAGLVFLSTPTSEDGVRDLVRAGAHGLKNGSDFLTNTDLIRFMGASGLPTVISTGMATLAEIDDAVRAYQDGGGKDLVLLHCTSAYPTSPEDVHLRKLPVLARAFGYPVGLSDHSEGTAAATGAVVLGCCLIEKHFTSDRSLPGPDQWFSADPAELAALVAAARTVQVMLGDAQIAPTPTEEQSRREFRLSCVAAADLPEGHRLTEADVAFRRPGTGAPPRDLPWIVGRTLKSAVRQGTPFQPSLFV